MVTIAKKSQLIFFRRVNQCQVYCQEIFLSPCLPGTVLQESCPFFPYWRWHELMGVPPKNDRPRKSETTCFILLEWLRSERDKPAMMSTVTFVDFEWGPLTTANHENGASWQRLGSPALQVYILYFWRMDLNPLADPPSKIGTGSCSKRGVLEIWSFLPSFLLSLLHSA